MRKFHGSTTLISQNVKTLSILLENDTFNKKNERKRAANLSIKHR